MTSRNDQQQIDNQAALDSPQVGDYWHERFCPYFLIVGIDGEQITVLSCVGGENYHDRKHELNAKITTKTGWTFDFSKAMIVDKKWIDDLVLYHSIPGFVADVVRRAEKWSGCIIYEETKMNRPMPKHVNELKSEYNSNPSVCKITDSDRLMFVLQNGLPIEYSNDSFAYDDAAKSKTKIEAINAAIRLQNK